MPADVPSGEAQLRAYLRGIVPAFNPARWPAETAAVRRRLRSEIFLKGWDDDVLAGPPDVVWGETLDGPGYLVRKLRYAAVPHYWVPALLYVPVGPADRPRVAVLNAEGHHDSGNAAPYKQVRCINLARRGALALSFEFAGMGELAADAEGGPGALASLHHGLAELDFVGVGSASLMFLAMTRALDVLLSQPDADPERVAMTGLSGGGWQTIVLSALDPRVRVAVPVAGYTSLPARVEHCADVGDVEQVPPDLGAIADYPDLTAMLAPRPALLILNEHDDCCFRTDRTRREIFDQVRPVYAAAQAGERLQLYSNTRPGTHNFGADNRGQLYRFLGRWLDEPWTAEELHTPAEIRSEAELAVGLPADQTTVRGIAEARARRLRQERDDRLTGLGADRRRAELTRLLRLPPLSTGRLELAWDQPWRGEIEVGPWRLPGRFTPGEGTPVITVADVADPPAQSSPVPTLEVGLLGLAGLPCSLERALLLQCCGERLLGVQVAQALQVARGLSARHGGPVSLHGHGTVATMVLTLTAALVPELFDRLRLSGSRLVRLDDLLYRGISPALVPSLYCPDLLRSTDVHDLRPLLDGVVVEELDRGLNHI